MEGRNRFMGYFKNEEETKKVIDDKGFLHSGDLGKIDSSGELNITGRIKCLIVTAGGENVAPILIENVLLELMPFFSKAMIIGNNEKFIATFFTF